MQSELDSWQGAQLGGYEFGVESVMFPPPPPPLVFFAPKTFPSWSFHPHSQFSPSYIEEVSVVSNLGLTIFIRRKVTLKGHTLNMEDFTQYLGVELQSYMSWNRHMDQAVKKANSTLGFL